MRRLALPAAPTDLKFELPKDFKPPDGVEFALDPNDPLVPQAQQIVHDILNGKVSGQDAMSKLVGLYAAGQVSQQQFIKTAKDAQIAKLGVNGSARVTAINTFLEGKGIPELKGMLVTADIVQAMEKMIGMVSASSTYQPPRQPGDDVTKVSDEEYNRMSFSERREYAAKHANGRAA